MSCRKLLLLPKSSFGFCWSYFDIIVCVAFFQFTQFIQKYIKSRFLQMETSNFKRYAICFGCNIVSFWIHTARKCEECRQFQNLLASENPSLSHFSCASQINVTKISLNIFFLLWISFFCSRIVKTDCETLCDTWIPDKQYVISQFFFNFTVQLFARVHL